ncbi:glyoxalase [Priestia megaterium]|nr:glyoxalase [Priestia megaterium]
MLLTRVSLYTSVLEEMKDFYVKHLGIKLLQEQEASFSLKIGQSELVFIQSKTNTNPFYHFAFNIPANQFEEAKRWTMKKVTLNKEDGEDEVYFEAFDAHSLYFEDPAHNIVELIARHSFSPNSDAPFSPDSLLTIGEMSVTTPNVKNVGQTLIQGGIHVRNHRPLNDEFNFMGNKGVYLLVGPPKRRWYFSNHHAEVHPLAIEMEDGKKLTINQDGMFAIQHA